MKVASRGILIHSSESITKQLTAPTIETRRICSNLLWSYDTLRSTHCDTCKYSQKVDRVRTMIRGPIFSLTNLETGGFVTNSTHHHSFPALSEKTDSRASMNESVSEWVSEWMFSSSLTRTAANRFSDHSESLNPRAEEPSSEPSFVRSVSPPFFCRLNEELYQIERQMSVITNCDNSGKPPLSRSHLCSLWRWLLHSISDVATNDHHRHELSVRLLYVRSPSFWIH